MKLKNESLALPMPKTHFSASLRRGQNQPSVSPLTQLLPMPLVRAVSEGKLKADIGKSCVRGETEG